MNQVSVIADQVRKVYEGDAWHGPSLRETLNGVTAEQAIAHPVGEAHSIAEIVAHIGGWSEVARRRIVGETIAEPDEGDFPEVSAANWKHTVEEVLRRGTAFADAIDALDESSVTEMQLGNAIGTLHHAIYHTGQIAVLRKG